MCFLSFFFRVMSSLYCLWDILDDLVFRKAYESDASKFAKLCGLSSQTWGVIWFLISLIFFVGAILIALVAFKRRFYDNTFRYTIIDMYTIEDKETQQEQAAGFGW